jgi:hypothetical protein
MDTARSMFMLSAFHFPAPPASAAATTYVYPFGRDNAPIVAEMKSRRSGAGFAALERWLGKYGPLFLSRNNTDPLVALPWSVLARIIGVVRS